ncbi:MAG: hypothetical protein K9M54_08760 [Kiritimatiellales bacterium]|nr:hypothetical protein [Kiritimatiellales bacterium]
MEYTQLERGVLNWMMNHVDVPNLADQIRVAVPTEREYTGHGFFTTLSVPLDIARIETPSPINGPVIESPGVEYGGAAILFLDDFGHIEILEMYANGDRFAEKITDFRLKAWEESNH